MSDPPVEKIDNLIKELDDWRGDLLAHLRKLILEASPEIQEEWKWNTAVWTQQGPICSIAAFKSHLKLNFFKGASLPDPEGLFNAGLEAKATRAIDFQNGDSVDAKALTALIKAAVAHQLTPKQML